LDFEAAAIQLAFSVADPFAGVFASLESLVYIPAFPSDPVGADRPENHERNAGKSSA
jgi:hypothetical protein